jgi:hypothetical protein
VIRASKVIGLLWLGILLISLAAQAGAQQDLKLNHFVADEIEWYLNRNKDFCFHKYLRLGDPVLLRQTVMRSVIVIDRAYCEGTGSQAAAAPGAGTEKDPHRLILLHHPLATDENDRSEWALTMLHEVYHLVEYEHGDLRVYRDQKDKNEKHVFYLEFLAKDITTNLQLLEKAAGRGEDPGSLKSRYWNRFEQELKTGCAASNKTYPHGYRMDEFYPLIGANVDFDGLRAHYASGHCGPQLQAMFGAEVLPADGLRLENIVLRKLAARVVEITVQYSLHGVADGAEITTRARATTTGPNGQQLKQTHSMKAKGSGRHSDTFSVVVPPGFSPGQYETLVILEAQKKFSRSLERSFRIDPIAAAAPDPPEPEPAQPQPTFSPVVAPAPPPIDPNVDPPTQPGPFSVSISGPQTTSVGQRVAFSPKLSGEPVEPVHYTWYLKGKSIHKVTVAGRFDQPGSQSVRLVAKDSAGRTSSADFLVNVQESKLRVQVAGPSTTPVGKIVNLSGQVQGGTPPYSYAWLTDGKRWSTERVTLDYDTPGQKAVELTVRDSQGVEGRGSLVIAVKDGVAVNVAGPREAQVGRAVTYTPTVVTGPPSGFVYNWSVDGQSGSGESFSPVFQTPGRKTMILSAKHPDYPLYRCKAFIDVKAADASTNSTPLNAKISGPAQLKAGEKVSFMAVVKGGVPPYRFLWTVKGKQLSKEVIAGRFEKAGSYPVKLQVSDSDGGSASASLMLAVEESASDMQVSIVAPSVVTAGEVVALSPRVRGGTGPYRYRWTIEGKTVDKQSVKGKFDQEGRQRVSLAVYDSGAHSAEPSVASIVIEVKATAQSSPPSDPDAGTQASKSEFVGTYKAFTVRDGVAASGSYPQTFMANGVWAQNRDGRLTNRGTYSIRGGILTVEHPATTISSRSVQSGPLTRVESTSDGRKKFTWKMTQSDGLQFIVFFTQMKDR